MGLLGKQCKKKVYGKSLSLFSGKRFAVASQVIKANLCPSQKNSVVSRTINMWCYFGKMSINNFIKLLSGNCYSRIACIAMRKFKIMQ